jgi:tetratricopeptide (TPR) repeat protein
MRTLLVPVFYVSLAAVCLANTPEAESKTAPEWRKNYEAGLEASRLQHYDEALSLFQHNWDHARSDEERGVVSLALGQIYHHLGRHKDAAQWFDRALHAWSAESMYHDPRQSLMAAVSAVDLADSFRDTGDYDHSELTLRQALTAPAADEAPKAMVRNSLADLLREEGRDAEAEPVFNENLKDPSSSPHDRGGSLIGIADIERRRHAWDASVEHWNQALEINRRAGDSRSEAIALRGLAITWLDSGSPARAEPLLKRSAQIIENLPEPAPEQLASTLSGLGELYRFENKLTLAENEWTKALQLDRNELGEVHPQVAWLMEMLADVISARGEFSVACDYANRAAEAMSAAFGADSMPFAAALTNRALVEERATRFDEAAQDYQRAIGIARDHASNRTLYAAMLQRYADFLKAAHRGREAKAIAIEARSFR